MTAKNVIDAVDAIKPNAFSQDAKLAWLREVEGTIQLETWMCACDELTYATINAEMLVKDPFTDVYMHWLEYKIDFANGEYDKAINTKEAFDAAYKRYAGWFVETYEPAQAPFYMKLAGGFAAGDESPKQILHLLSGDIIMRMECVIMDAFDDDDAQIIVGVEDDDDVLMPANVIDAQTAGQYTARSNYMVPVDGRKMIVTATANTTKGKAQFYCKILRKQTQR